MDRVTAVYSPCHVATQWNNGQGHCSVQSLLCGYIVKEWTESWQCKSLPCATQSYNGESLSSLRSMSCAYTVKEYVVKCNKRCVTDIMWYTSPVYMCLYSLTHPVTDTFSQAVYTSAPVSASKQAQNLANVAAEGTICMHGLWRAVWSGRSSFMWLLQLSKVLNFIIQLSVHL